MTHPDRPRFSSLGQVMNDAANKHAAERKTNEAQESRPLTWLYVGLLIFATVLSSIVLVAIYLEGS